MDQLRSKWRCKKKRVGKSEGKGWRKKMANKKKEKMKETTATERKQRKKRRRRIVNFV